MQHGLPPETPGNDKTRPGQIRPQPGSPFTPPRASATKEGRAEFHRVRGGTTVARRCHETVTILLQESMVMLRTGETRRFDDDFIQISHPSTLEERRLTHRSQVHVAARTISGWWDAARATGGRGDEMVMAGETQVVRHH